MTRDQLLGYYESFAGLCGAASFVGCWVALGSQYGLLGVLLGWFPAFFGAVIGMLLGPPVILLGLICLVVLLATRY